MAVDFLVWGLQGKVFSCDLKIWKVCTVRVFVAGFSHLCMLKQQTCSLRGLVPSDQLTNTGCVFLDFLVAFSALVFLHVAESQIVMWWHFFSSNKERLLFHRIHVWYMIFTYQLLPSDPNWSPKWRSRFHPCKGHLKHPKRSRMEEPGTLGLFVWQMQVKHTSPMGSFGIPQHIWDVHGT